jgi:hypothetical protein
MALKTTQERRSAVDRMFANWRIEGFEPDAEYVALLERYVVGTITLKEIGAQIDLRHGVTERVGP